MLLRDKSIRTPHIIVDNERHHREYLKAQLATIGVDQTSINEFEHPDDMPDLRDLFVPDSHPVLVCNSDCGHRPEMTRTLLRNLADPKHAVVFETVEPRIGFRSGNVNLYTFDHRNIRVAHNHYDCERDTLADFPGLPRKKILELSKLRGNERKLPREFFEDLATSDDWRDWIALMTKSGRRAEDIISESRMNEDRHVLRALCGAS